MRHRVGRRGREAGIDRYAQTRCLKAVELGLREKKAN